jgi:hypothetical protein
MATIRLHSQKRPITLAVSLDVPGALRALGALLLAPAIVAETLLLHRLWCQLSDGAPNSAPGTWLYSLSGEIVAYFRQFETASLVNSGVGLEFALLVAIEVFLVVAFMGLMALILGRVLRQEHVADEPLYAEVEAETMPALGASIARRAAAMAYRSVRIAFDWAVNYVRTDLLRWWNASVTAGERLRAIDWGKHRARLNEKAVAARQAGAIEWHKQLARLNQTTMAARRASAIQWNNQRKRLNGTTTALAQRATEIDWEKHRSRFDATSSAFTQRVGALDWRTALRSTRDGYTGQLEPPPDLSDAEPLRHLLQR